MQHHRRSRALWIEAPGHAAVRTQPLEPAGPGEVTIRAQYSAISRGTESLVFRGKVPPSEFARMRAPFQEGEFPGPVKYGYASVGVVEAGPPELLDGQVFCLYPHQTRYRVPTSAVTPLPPNVPPDRAVLGANMETAVNIVWDACPALGDRINVVGAGVVGCLAAYLCARIPGARVTLVDVAGARQEIAEALGVGFAPPAKAPGNADLVIHASGQPEGLRTALGSAGFEATVVEASWYGSDEVTVPLGEAFHSRRLCLCSSQVGQLPPGHRSRWGHAERLQLALRLLADATLDRLITGECAFEELPGELERLSVNAGGALCHRVRYPEP